ncbi:Transthyretin (synonym: prealbumin) [Glarea lozoyensis ATCC 20868]|uniref:5-hydroxyisourate hydrolase n=1 Tax=Glarea lozoyensis (strain ATCC 20868 / MF5171) TaxID=1116229 RepID=S3CMF5_GLAL2|nr:Transthyretin (synonym: prealbumin) [Glarea lozoyensis ATCC 20868]EPE27692.1 Transthyretin (synonym: prealbumin) [Glarea lozoyensis ATCC 20868]
MATDRDPITCHVLDTTTGRPGANISVKLYNTSLPNYFFSATTNGDGRIANWQLPEGSNETIASLIHDYASQEGKLVAGCPLGSSIWKLQFDTGSYYGVQNTFFPKVELTFLVKEGEHFHVPLLLGPYSFTTYRGS